MNIKTENLALIDAMYDFLKEHTATYDMFRSQFFQTPEETEQLFLKHLFKHECNYGKETLRYFGGNVEKDGLAYYITDYYGFKRISLQFISDYIAFNNLIDEGDDFSVVEKNERYLLVRLFECNDKLTHEITQYPTREYQISTRFGDQRKKFHCIGYHGMNYSEKLGKTNTQLSVDETAKFF